MARIGGINAAFFVIDNPVYRMVEDPKGQTVGVFLDDHGHWVVEEVEWAYTVYGQRIQKQFQTVGIR